MSPSRKDFHVTKKIDAHARNAINGKGKEMKLNHHEVTDVSGGKIIPKKVLATTGEEEDDNWRRLETTGDQRF